MKTATQFIKWNHLLSIFPTLFNIPKYRLFNQISLHRQLHMVRFLIHQMTLKLLLLLACVLVARCAEPKDEMTITIPGYTQHKWYSGYLNFTHGAFHYVFFDSQHDPDNDPVVLWLNGGPGCSSLIGMVYQNGPFLFAPNKTNFLINENAWNKRANVLYITSPQGVGFSVGTPERLDDGTVAEYNLKALLNFFYKFPSLKKNDFYISGESYAGIYIPYLAKQILAHNEKPSEKDRIIKLKGILIGNACTNPRECYEPGNDGMSLYQYEFLYNHAYISESEHSYIQGACTLGYNSQNCAQIRKIVDKKFEDTKTSILNIYAPCYYQSNGNEFKLRQSGRRTRVNIDEGACEDSVGIHHYFNENSAHVNYHVNNIKFSQCSDDVADKYIMFANASEWIYPTLIKAGLRIMIYSGDVDADVPITGTLKWIERLKEEAGLPVLEPWREWWVHGLHKHEDQVGGMVWKLKGFTFVSVRGAGHMVPKDKGKQAYVMLRSFLNNEPLPQKSQ